MFRRGSSQPEATSHVWLAYAQKPRDASKHLTGGPDRTYAGHTPHLCRAQCGGGSTRAELKVKNNRGFVRQITIPSGAAYADVEDQPEPVRTLVRTVAGGQDLVLLPPGDELRVGFAQPAKVDHNVELAPSVSALALARELVIQRADLADERGSMALLPALINVAGCGGIESQVVAGVLPNSL